MFRFRWPGPTVKPRVGEVIAELSGVFDDREIADWFLQPNSGLAQRSPADVLDTEPRAALQAARVDRFVADGQRLGSILHREPRRRRFVQRSIPRIERRCRMRMREEAPRLRAIGAVFESLDAHGGRGPCGSTRPGPSAARSWHGTK